MSKDSQAKSKGILQAKIQAKIVSYWIGPQGAEKSLATVPGAKFKSHYPVPPAVPDQPFSASVTMNHDSVFIAGRYNKYSRDGIIFL